MALNKLALGLIAGVISVGVIGGVTAAVVTRQNAETSTINPDGTETENKPQDKPNTNQAETTINLQDVVNKFKAIDIVLTNGATKNETYAFNVKKEQLVLAEQAMKTVPTGVDVEIDSINNTTDGVLLNEGKLSVTLKASFKDKAKQESITNIVLVEGFKASSEVLRNYLKPLSEDAQTNVLNLTKPVDTDNSITFTSIEALNAITPTLEPGKRSSKSGITEVSEQDSEMTKISGITTLFRQINKPKTEESNAENISVVGKVKLAKITKTNKQEEPVFHLVSAIEETSLKLVQDKQEALVNEIIITKLTASNVSLALKDFDEEEQSKFLEKFKSEAQGKMYAVGDSGYSLEVKKEPAEQKVSVSINPLLAKRIQKEQMLIANLTISYGSEIGVIKTYSTSKKENIEELKNAGFSFSVYSKKLEGTDEVIQSTKITDTTNKLDTFFTKEGLVKGVDKTTLEETNGSSGKKPIGGFSLISLKDTELKGDFSLGEVKTSQPISKDGLERRGGELDAEQEKWVSENWISFVGYSFGKELENKVLFIPIINLIHVAETKHVGTTDLVEK